MDIKIYKEKMLSFYKKMQDIAENGPIKEYSDYAGRIVDAFEELIRFLEDEQNIIVLDKYCKKMSNVDNQCPLDELCRSVVEKLDEIDQLNTDDVLEILSIGNEAPIRTSVITNNNEKINGIISKLGEKNFLNTLSAFNVLKHLEGHSKTLIILGANGSGKTSFANYLKNLDSHVKVIPASKPISAVGHIPNMYNASLNVYNTELYKGGVLNQDLLQKLIIGMCTEHDDIARKYLDTQIRDKKSTYEKVKVVFDEFFDVKLDNSAFSLKQMSAKKGTGSPFGFNNMSDGERVAFFYIATVIAAPEKSFIIVDEPENHLNPAVYNRIWERLIESRNDCQFIFISHTMDFVSARSNYEIVKIKTFEYPDKFEFVFLGDSLEKIKPEFIVEIVGSRKPILFCEGSKSDYDYKIYDCIFGNNYTVIPVGNCTSVEKSVEACNHYVNAYSIQSAIGIVDLDMKSQDEIERLKNKKVYTLSCNEIEMLLIDEEVFKAVLSRAFKDELNFNKFKDRFFKKIEERKMHIIKRFAKTRIDERIKQLNIDDRNNRTKEEFQDSIDSLFKGINVAEIWQDCETKIDSVIASRNYQEAIKYCCLEHKEIVAGICNKFVPEYAYMALGIIRSDSKIAEALKERYLSEIE